jgi:hypothetical protein
MRGYLRPKHDTAAANHVIGISDAEITDAPAATKLHGKNNNNAGRPISWSITAAWNRDRYVTDEEPIGAAARRTET